MKTLNRSLVLLPLTFTLASLSASADPIVKQYQSVRTSGMGGVKLLTGLYDENFYGNPARTMANDKFRITVFDLTLEGNSNLSTTANAASKSGDVLSNIGSTAGNNNHFRIQTSFPSVYIPAGDDGKNSYAFGLLTSTQGDIDLHRYFQPTFPVIADIGPALSFARRFFPDNSLVVGTTLHATYRAAFQQNFTLVDLIHGSNLPSINSASDGIILDDDLGATYVLPIAPLDFKITAGAAINNVLGGTTTLSVHLAPAKINPPTQPRTLGFGASASRDSLGPFTNFLLSFEVQDIGNNPDGSLYRTIHIGSEARFGILLPRIGINQGYVGAGLGIDLRHFTIDLATYGEELTLDSGISEDRRYVARIAFQI